MNKLNDNTQAFDNLVDDLQRELIASNLDDTSIADALQTKILLATENIEQQTQTIPQMQPARRVWMWLKPSLPAVVLTSVLVVGAITLIGVFPEPPIAVNKPTFLVTEDIDLTFQELFLGEDELLFDATF